MPFDGWTRQKLYYVVYGLCRKLKIISIEEVIALIVEFGMIPNDDFVYKWIYIIHRANVSTSSTTKYKLNLTDKYRFEMEYSSHFHNRYPNKDRFPGKDIIFHGRYEMINEREIRMIFDKSSNISILNLYQLENEKALKKCKEIYNKRMEKLKYIDYKKNIKRNGKEIRQIDQMIKQCNNSKKNIYWKKYSSLCNKLNIKPQTQYTGKWIARLNKYDYDKLTVKRITDGFIWVRFDKKKEREDILSGALQWIINVD